MPRRMLADNFITTIGYDLNPELKINGLTACVYYFNSVGIIEDLDEGSTIESFCQGT